MIQYNERFDTREEAQAFVDRELRSYPPQGYDTDLRITDLQRRGPGRFAVTGSRQRSCD